MQPATSLVPPPRSRVLSIDLLRGVVMILMALDHVRDYFHADAFLYDPLDLDKTSPLLFFTRWITHYCAPIFMLLAGTSAFIVGERKGTKALASFLFRRGLFLVIMEFTVINFGWYFNIRFTSFDFIVIWSLGMSMIALAGMVYLPKKIILAIGIVLVAGHNLLDNVHVAGRGAGAFLWSLLHEPNGFKFGSKQIFVGYPLLPWIGTIALGYSLGSLYSKTMDAAKRKKYLLWLGGGAILLFIILRYINIYGDLFPWHKQGSPLYTVLAFIRVHKYPPSLDYLLMTIGPALVFLAMAETKLNRPGKFISVYGRVPMFYYILHIYLIHLLAMIATNFCGHQWTDMIWTSWGSNPNLGGYGFSLAVVYGVWVSVILLLYPVCRWYDRYKSSHREKWWLGYL